MKLLIKLAVTAAVAHALFRVGTEYFIHYEFRDSVREAAMYQAKSDEELHERIMDLAVTYHVPLAPNGFTTRRDGREAVVEGSYVKPIEILPGFPYDWRFNFLIQAYVSTVPPLPGAPTRKPVPPVK